MKLMYKNSQYVFLMLSLIITCQLSHAFEWGFAERQGYRSSMEDAHVIEEEGPSTAYAIFDGHSGKDAADFAALRLKRDLALGISLTSLDEMISWIKRLESDLDKNDIRISGSTMITALIDKKTKFARLFWVGDARAIVVRAGKVIEATNDHNLKTEADRLKKANATIVGNYIRNPQGKGLAVPRTIGDLTFKKDGPAIISDPEMKSIQLNTGDYLVLACDGLWDALSNEDVAQYIASNPKLSPIDDASLRIAGGRKVDIASSQGSLKTLAQSLRDKAFSTFRTRDNISVIVVKI